MGYLDEWLGDGYLDDWFDNDAATSVPTSGAPGISKSLPLSTLAPRPQLPIWRQIAGPTGMFLTDIRNTLQDTLARDHLWGNHVDVEFTAAATAVMVRTGLGGPAKGYKIVRSNADIRVWDASPPEPSEERGVLWLQASGAGKVTIYVY